jgi:hypothetical protein
VCYDITFLYIKGGNVLGGVYRFSEGEEEGRAAEGGMRVLRRGKGSEEIIYRTN